MHLEVLHLSDSPQDDHPKHPSVFDENTYGQMDLQSDGDFFFKVDPQNYEYEGPLIWPLTYVIPVEIFLLTLQGIWCKHEPKFFNLVEIKVTGDIALCLL